MSVAPSEALERSVLEGKDREQLLTIAAALGVKPATRAKKADIIDKILEQVGVPTGAPAVEGAPAVRKPARTKAARAAEAAQAAATLDLEPASSAEGAPEAPADPPSPVVADDPAPARTAEPRVVLGPDGEPLAEWELELGDDDGDGADGVDDGQGGVDLQGAGNPDGQSGEGEPREGRRRRRRRNRNRTGEDGAAPAVVGSPAPVVPAVVAPVVPRIERPERSEEQRVDIEALSNEPVEVAGHVDLRDEGFGFLRVRGHLASRDDIYVSVKQVRQFGLRKGDHVVGTSRPAGRNEKNPALLSVVSVNGGDPEAARSRPRFDDLTAVFPDTPLRLESADDDGDPTARIIDLVAPMGKGQRCLVVSPPRAGKTSVLRAIATSVERNHPEVHLVVLLVDERPEEVTEMRRAVRAEVVATTFDDKPGEHTQVAEMTVEKAKRLVEAGRDVVLVVDGLTRLARAYNLTGPATGRVVHGGIDTGALHQPKRFFGAARRAEEGGSLTIVATVLAGTGSAMDETIFEELEGSANMVLRLDRHLAEQRIFPAIDVAASGTRNEDRLVDERQLPSVRNLRRALAAEASEAAPAVQVLAGRVATFPTNAQLLDALAP